MDFIRVFFSDDSYKSIVIKPTTQTEEVCSQFIEKMMITTNSKFFTLKELRPDGTNRLMSLHENVWDLKKQWEKMPGYSPTDSKSKYQFVFTFTEEARNRISRKISATDVTVTDDGDADTQQGKKIFSNPGFVGAPLPGLAQGNISAGLAGLRKSPNGPPPSTSQNEDPRPSNIRGPGPPPLRPPPVNKFPATMAPKSAPQYASQPPSRPVPPSPVPVGRSFATLSGPPSSIAPTRPSTSTPTSPSISPVPSPPTSPGGIRTQPVNAGLPPSSAPTRPNLPASRSAASPQPAIPVSQGKPAPISKGRPLPVPGRALPQPKPKGEKVNGTPAPKAKPKPPPPSMKPMVRPASPVPVAQVEDTSFVPLESEEFSALSPEEFPPLSAEEFSPLDPNEFPSLQAEEFPSLQVEEFPSLQAEEFPSLQAEEFPYVNPPTSSYSSNISNSHKTPTLLPLDKDEDDEDLNRLASAMKGQKERTDQSNDNGGFDDLNSMLASLCAQLDDF